MLKGYFTRLIFQTLCILSTAVYFDCYSNLNYIKDIPSIWKDNSIRKITCKRAIFNFQTVMKMFIIQPHQILYRN